ncbi:hypothetical protein [Sanyastnella coralliicola]|uniref:hypothetical protein n=1 Tax=Sanyastnella coralliicola TaxID=3069118 RepID=UPI0027BA4E5E|nr:hypothetical protein [Longitalea sp. SCSIO 12813]
MKLSVIVLFTTLRLINIASAQDSDYGKEIKFSLEMIESGTLADEIGLLKNCNLIWSEQHLKVGEYILWETSACTTIREGGGEKLTDLSDGTLSAELEPIANSEYHDFHLGFGNKESDREVLMSMSSFKGPSTLWLFLNCVEFDQCGRESSMTFVFKYRDQTLIDWCYVTFIAGEWKMECN